MKQRLLQYLVCPRCGDALSLTGDAAAEEVLAGELRCASGDHRFPITGGIPRLLPPELAQDVQRTSDNFGWQWLEFSTLHPSEDLYQSQFLDWIYPIQPDYFTDKVVLDAGCGMGRFALASAEFGAKDVLAIDVSEAVEAAYANTRHMPNVHVIQADIYNLPFKQPLDFAFSIGVLHHLPNPEGGFRALVRHLKPGGTVFAWVYGRENNGWIVNIVSPLRSKVFSRLPRMALYSFSLLAALMVHPTLKLLYRPANTWSFLKPLTKILPYNGYLSWLAQFGFRHNHHVIYDHLAAPTAFYISRQEFQEWFRRASLSQPTISWRNQNSWRGWAVLEHAGPSA